MTIDLATTLPHLPTNRFTSHHLPTNKKTSYHITSLHITSSPRKNDGKTTTNHQRERLNKNTCFGQRTWDLSELFVSEESWGLYKSLHQKPATIQIFVSTQLCSTCDGHWIGKDQPLHLLHGCHDQISIGSALIVGRTGNDDSWAERRQFWYIYQKTTMCSNMCTSLLLALSIWLSWKCQAVGNFPWFMIRGPWNWRFCKNLPVMTHGGVSRCQFVSVPAALRLQSMRF